MFDHSLALDDSQSTFLVVGGKGEGSLDVYRRVQIEGHTCFEKIYRTDSDDLLRLKWFHTEVLPQFRGKLKTAKIKKMLSGKRLTVVYFEFIPDFVKLKQDLVFHELLKFRQISKSVHCKNVDPRLMDFRREPMYIEGICRLVKLLEKHKEPIRFLHQAEHRFLSNESSKQFTHGDIHWKNISMNGEVIDFDKCGFYPTGYEIGRVVGNFLNVKSPKEVKEHILSYANLESFETLFGGIFFATVFYSRRIGVQKSDDFILALYRLMKQFLGGYWRIDDQTTEVQLRKISN